MGNNFKKLGLEEDLVELLKSHRIEEATPIQDLAIPEILGGKDLVGKAQTGTGKTLAFLLPIFQMMEENDKTQALIISPTRELALQLGEEAEKLKAYKDLEVLVLYGGRDIESQKNRLKRGVNLVVGTPGRLLDHMERGTIDLSNIDYLVLDEADEIINMGFYEDVKRIIDRTSKQRQTMLFSATMPKKIKNISRSSMKSPVRLEAKEEDLRDKKIKEVIINTKESEKLDQLSKYIDENNPFMGIIFCRSKDRVKELTLEMAARGYVVDELHGDLSQTKREKALKDFRELKTHFLIATDIAARGLDIEGVTHVFNYDMPAREIGYIHRIGRTGRQGEDGIAVTFVTKEDERRKEMKDKKDRKPAKKKNYSKKFDGKKSFKNKKFKKSGRK